MDLDAKTLAMVAELNQILESDESIEEAATKTEEAIHRLTYLIGEINDVLDDIGNVLLAATKTGIVISLYAAGNQEVSLIRGDGESIKKALGHLVKEIIKE